MIALADLSSVSLTDNGGIFCYLLFSPLIVALDMIAWTLHCKLAYLVDSFPV